jgi:hypothetical protein
MVQQPTRQTRAESFALFALLCLALALRLHGIGRDLPWVLEEAVPFKTAWWMWGFDPPGRFDLNPHTFGYPSLVFYLQFSGQAFTIAALAARGLVHSALDLRLLQLLDPTPFYLVGRSITALFGALTVLPTWALARRVAGARAAVAAALLIAIHPMSIAKSQLIDVDITLTFFVTLGMALAVALPERATVRSCLLAGIVGGLAASAKYPGLVLLAPLAVAVWRSPRTARSGPGSPVQASGTPHSPRRREKAAAGQPLRRRSAGRLARAGLVLAGTLLGFFLTSPYFLLDGHTVWRDFTAQWQNLTFRHFGIAEGPSYGAYAHDWFASIMGWPLGVASLSGLAYFGVRRRPWALVAGALFVSYVAIVGSWQMRAERYLLPLVPMGAVCAVALVEAATRVPFAARRRWAPWLLATICTLALAMPLLGMLATQWVPRPRDTRILAREWIEKHLAPGSFLGCEPYVLAPLSPLDMQDVKGELRAALESRGQLARLYAVQMIPVFVVVPERSAKFYSPATWRIADALVVTSSIRERYRQDPQRYAVQLAFYDTLEARWSKLVSFEPHGGPGPAITVYGNPAVTLPFARRRAMPPIDTTLPALGGLSGAEGFFYYNLGLNYEAFAFLPQAQESYLMALRFGQSEPDTYVHSAMRLVSTLWKQGRPQAALATAQVCVDRAPGRLQADQLAGFGAALAEGLVFSRP